MSKLSGVLWWWGGKSKDYLKLCLWNLNSTSNSPVAPPRLSCQISDNQHEAETSANVNKHWKTGAKESSTNTTLLLVDKLTPVVNVCMFCRDNNGRFSAGMYHMLLNKANSPVLRNNFRHRNQVPSYLTCLLETVFFKFLFQRRFSTCIGVLMWYMLTVATQKHS